jgi:pimeloyl-ACP methyl ester carboxylesterase
MTEFSRFGQVMTAWRQEGKGRDVILLHGWGQNMEMMGQIENHLQLHFHVWNLDFPGFGQSQDPPVPWGVPDYVAFLEDFVAKNNIQEPILIAHSFGCRVAIRYAAAHPEVRKMCLTGAAGIRPQTPARSSWKTRIFHAGTRFLKATHQDKLLETVKEHSGSADYRAARGVMRDTFVKVVNDDVRPILKDVHCPVLLVWGENDTAVPLEMGRIMEKEMPDAGLAVFEGDDHFAYWHQAERFNRVLDIFLKEDAS